MKSLSQIVLAIGAVVVLVAGVTFVSQYQVGVVEEEKPAPVKPAETATPTATVSLNFLRGTIWEWKPPSEGQFEQQTSGHHDFWFQNDNNVPARLGLKAKSCKCSEVSVGLLPADEIQRYRKAPADSPQPVVQPKLQVLEVDDANGVIVAPGQGGVVRLAFEDKKEKSREDRPERLVVQVWSQGVQGGPKTYNNLELPIVYVPALRLTDAYVSLEDLNPNEEKTKEVKCWSSTRAQFPLTVKEPSADPCIQCTCLPLDEHGRTELAKSTGTRVLCGYTVRVTVRERLNDKVQMELGPFTRRIVLTSTPEIGSTGFLLTGAVKGEVTIGSEEEKGRINLGFFPAKYGAHKTVILTAHRSDLDLQVDKVEPEELTHLKVKSLKKIGQQEGRARWELSVEVPPGSPSGRLPDHSAVLLTLSIPGNPPRHIRIPVLGNATQ